MCREEVVRIWNILIMNEPSRGSGITIGFPGLCRIIAELLEVYAFQNARDVIFEYAGSKPYTGSVMISLRPLIAR